MAGMYGCFKGRNSDSAAMASGPPDLMTNQEPSEVQEECSGKKKSKFQTFKKFFARKKRKEPQTAEAEAGLKVSQSSDNVSKTPENNTLTRSEKGSGSKVSLGGKALSHDSVFVSDSSETNEALGASQDSIHGKVKTLQLQLKQAIRLGSPPSLICVKKTEDGGTTSEDDGLPCSPPEYTNYRSNQAQRNSSNSLQAIDSDDDKLSCAASSRAMSPLVAPGDFGQPASPFSCLDNSAAKHKLGLRHKACNKRKPASRLELRAEGEESTISSPGAETETERAEDESGDDLKPKLDREEEEEEEEEEVEEDEEEEEKGQEQDSTVSLLRDEGEEDDVEAEQEVSHAPDESCPSEMNLSEEEPSDEQLLSSTKLSSRSSSPITPRASPEPPAGPKEHPVSPAGSSPCEAEDLHADGDSVSEGEDVLQTHVEEESSFLEEVLSSLKTPLASHSPDAETEGDVLEIKGERKEREEGVVETEGVETEGVETDEEVVIKDEEADGYQAASSCAALSDQTNEEEEEEVPDYTLQEEGVEVGEEVEGSEEEVDFEEEDVAVEQFTQHEDEEDMQEEEAEEVKPEEEHDTLTRQSTSQEGEEEEAEEDEREDEATDMEEKPEGEEEVKEESEAGYGEEEAEERGKVEDEEEEEKGDAEELTERIPDFQAEELEMTSPVQEEDEGVVEDDDDDDDQNTKYTDDEIPIEMGGQALARGHEGRDDRDQSSRDESKDEEEAGLIEQEEEDEGQPDQTGEDLELESDETESHFNMKQNESSDAAGQTPALSRPHPLAPPESHPDTPSDEGAVSPTSKAAFLHINLVSPSAEKATSLFQLHPAAEDPRERVTESPPSALESSDLNADEEQAGSLEDQEPKQSTVHHHHHHHDASVRSPEQEAPTQPTDQSKVRFTVAPAWQRSQSLGSSPPLTGCVSPSSPVSEPRGDEKDHDTRAESTKTPHSSGAERTSESSVIVEGNPENPFGVRLRKTSALRRFSSEEETTELPAESPAPTACSKVDSPQPVGDKTSTCLPNNNKPALPKKPDIHGEAGAKLRRISEPAPGRGPSGGSDPPSWISMAKQKQKVYKENSQDEFTATKEEQEIKPSLPISVSSAASRKPSNKTHECTSKEGHSEISKPSVFAEKEIRRFFSPPTPVPPQPLKSQLLPSPVAPKPQVLPPTPKHPAQTSSSQIPLSPPTPVPVPSKSPSCSTPSHLSKPATAAQTPAVTSPPFSTRTTPDKSGFRAPGLPRQAVSPQRDLPSPALPQDEPPWMALAKKKAKAWSEMPQIVQ